MILIVIAAGALAAPLAPLPPPDRQDLARRLEGPSPGHPLGLDDLGRDVLSRVLWGARISLAVGLSVVLIAGTFGVAAGSVSGYLGGRVDAVLMALVDLLLGFPGVLLAIALVAVLGPRLSNLILALCLIGWVGYARLARSLALGLRGSPFADAARSAGCGPARVLLRHLLPNLLGPCLVQAALGLGGAVLSEAGLSFLGLGVPAPAPSWGGMLRAGSQNLLEAPHLAIAPGVAIFAAVLGANLIAEGMRQRLDPRGGAQGTTL
ncbi:MAG: ABC transporter permease [Acidobacteriota bacterium]